MDEQTKPRILIVEDDQDLRTILRLQLDSNGFEVKEASNGELGVAQVHEEKPDCVILDLMMPVMDGFGFLKRIRSVKGLQSVPILILTASEDERHRIRGFQYQANAYMSKPYNLEKLTETIHSLCAGKSLKS
ncbi:MAG: response regulator [Gemmatimonadales bacterium]|nr:response regulator [Gemmatimonadales bacterium]